MAVDLMEMVKGAVSRSIMEKMGGMAGTSPAQSSGVFEALAGSVLGGLMKKAAAPGGAEDIFQAVQKQDPGVLDRLGDLMGGGPGSADLQKSGMGVLDQIFGGDRSGLVNGIAKALGIDASKLGGLLAMIAPIVMGVIGKYLKNKTLNAAGLGSLLGDQKNFLGKYLPAGLGSQLGLGNLVGNLQQAAGTVQGTMAGAGRAMEQTAKSGGSLMKFLLPLLLLGIVVTGGVYWYITPREAKLSPTEPLERPRGNPDSAGQAGGGPSAGPAGGGAPGALTVGFAGPDFGDFDINGLGEKLAAIKKGFENVEPKKAGDVAGLLTSFGDEVGKLGIEKLTGSKKAMVGKQLEVCIEVLTESLARIEDESARKTLGDAFTTFKEKLKPYLR